MNATTEHTHDWEPWTTLDTHPPVYTVKCRLCHSVVTEDDARAPGGQVNIEDRLLALSKEAAPSKYNPPTDVPPDEWAAMLRGSDLARAIGKVAGDEAGDNADADLDYAGELEAAFRDAGYLIVATDALRATLAELDRTAAQEGTKE